MILTFRLRVFDRFGTTLDSSGMGWWGLSGLYVQYHGFQSHVLNNVADQIVLKAILGALGQGRCLLSDPLRSFAGLFFWCPFDECRPRMVPCTSRIYRNESGYASERPFETFMH